MKHRAGWSERSEEMSGVVVIWPVRSWSCFWLGHPGSNELLDMVISRGYGMEVWVR